METHHRSFKFHFNCKWTFPYSSSSTSGQVSFFRPLCQNAPALSFFSGCKNWLKIYRDDEDRHSSLNNKFPIFSCKWRSERIRTSVCFVFSKNEGIKSVEKWDIKKTFISIVFHGLKNMMWFGSRQEAII